MSPTLQDLLRRVHEADDAVEAERRLEIAIRQAMSAYDWRSILSAAVAAKVARAVVADIARRTLEHASAERDVWGMREVAKVRAELGDEAGARATLESAFVALATADDVRGYLWPILGAGYVDVLGDRDGLVRCLTTGRERARARRSADDLCAIGVPWAKEIDVTAGRTLVAEAEAAGTGNPWALANAWGALGDRAAVARVLDAALAAAATSGAALQVFAAWCSHGETARARDAHVRATVLARTAEDWLATAEAASDAKLDAAAIRASLESAEALVEHRVRARIARGYHAWLHDDAAAARVGPCGVRPEELRPRVGGGEWDASASALFDALRTGISPASLASIAAADYGMDAEKHLAALRQICTSGLLPEDLLGGPHEVLALVRWSSGENVDHVARAFAALLLCLVPSEVDDLVVDGVVLAESVLALEPEMAPLALRFFAWLLETAAADDREGRIARLLLVVLGATLDPDDERLGRTANALEDEDLAAAREAIGESMRASVWRDLLAELVPTSLPAVARVVNAVATR